MRRTSLLALLLCSIPCLGIAQDSPVIARVGDSPVTAADIRSALENLDAQTQAAAARDPSSLSQVVRAILIQRLVLKEALDKHWDQDPIVTAAVARLRDSAIAQTYLQSISKPPDDFPSDAEVQAAYDANKGQMIVPRQYDLAQIFVKDPKGNDPGLAADAKVKLDGVRKALSGADADFAAVARAESDDTQSATKGGELGWLAESAIQPAVRSQLGSLTKGTVSDPIKLDDGWHIIKVLDVKEPYTASLDEVRPQLIQRMRAERANEISQQYLAKLVQANPIQIDELALGKILKPQ